jgi:hypothetical protein
LERNSVFTFEEEHRPSEFDIVALRIGEIEAVIVFRRRLYTRIHWAHNSCSSGNIIRIFK